MYTTHNDSELYKYLLYKVRSEDNVLSSSNENVALLVQSYLVMKMDCSCSVSVLFGDEDGLLMFCFSVVW